MSVMFNFGNIYPESSKPKSEGIEMHAAHDASHFQNSSSACFFSRQSPVLNVSLMKYVQSICAGVQMPRKSACCPNSV